MPLSNRAVATTAGGNLVAGSATLVAALAGVFLAVGCDTALQAALLAMGCGKTNALRGQRTGGGFAISFGTEFFGHDLGSCKLIKPAIIPALPLPLPPFDLLNPRFS